MQNFVDVDNAAVILKQSTIPAIAVIGMTMVHMTGGIDLSLGYLVGLASITSGILANTLLRPAPAVQQLSIVARSSMQLVSTLSGSNQQRCVLGKWLCTAPRLLMLDEATREHRRRRKAQIHKLIDEIASTGVGILMISSELPELIGISDRVYIMREGGVTAELQAGPEPTQERVVACMV